MQLTQQLREEYRKLYTTAKIRPERKQFVTQHVKNICIHRALYEKVQEFTGVPWFMIGAYHSLEASLSFSKHLHNGDPLSARTTHVPPGRPKAGKPPFTWLESAIDALKYKSLDKVKQWDLETILFRLEGFNGYGYRNPKINIPSPYLWSMTNHYIKGKFVKDGVYSAKAVSAQVGAATMFIEMQRQGLINLTTFNVTPPDTMLDYAPKVHNSDVEKYQKFLRETFGAVLTVDGYAGAETSYWTQRIFGFYLYGDPRSK